MNGRHMDLPPTSEPGPLDAESMAPLCSVFRRYLKSRNLKYTPERADILNAIIEGDDVFHAKFDDYIPHAIGRADG